MAALYREHATGAYRYAVHLTGSQEDAEDLVQSAFLEAHRYLARGGEIMNARAWLATVVRTRANNLRRDRRETAASNRLETLAGALEQDAGAARAELDRVRAVLYELPEMQHQAFVLRYWSDLSYREIASALETTESAVESLLVRARAAIVSGAEIPSDCLEVRRLLSAGPVNTPAHMRHLGECAGCQAARTRLARAAGIAAAAALAPRIHVAHALAATVPGFTTSAATASVGIGGTTLAAGKSGMAFKAAVAALALAGSAAVVHTHGAFHSGAASLDPRRGPLAQPRAALASPSTASHPMLSAPALRNDEQMPSQRHDRPRHDDRANGRIGQAGGGRDGVTGPTGQGSGGGGDSQGGDGSSSSGADATAQDGGSNDDTQSSGATEGGGSSQDGNSQEGGGASSQAGNADS